jgi:hypothetical protein
MCPVQACLSRKPTLAASPFHTQTQALNHVVVVKHTNQSGHLLSPHFYPPIPLIHNAGAMGFNKRKMDDDRRQEAEKEAAARRATDRQILEDAEQLVTAWNERQANRMPMLFSPPIGAAITAGLWARRA